MKRTILSALLFFIFLFSNAQTDLLHSSGNWKLYNINKNAALHYSIDTLIRFGHAALAEDSMAYFLKEVKLLPGNKPAAWMGGYYATCEINTVPRKIDISMYGGFLYDEQDKQYYELPLKIRTQWINYLNRTFHTISSN